MNYSLERNIEQPSWSGNNHNAHVIEFIDHLLDKSDDELSDIERDLLSPFVSF